MGAWGYHHHHISSCIYLCSNMKSLKCVSRHSQRTRRDLMLEPLAGSCYGESRLVFISWQSDGLLHTSGITGYLAYITQWDFGHGLSCGCKSANMQRGKGPRASGSAGQRAEPQGQTTRAAALYSPFLYSLSKSKPQPKVNAYSACNEQITAGTAVLSPHRLGATYPVRNRLVAGIFDHFWAGYPNSPANYIKCCKQL